PERVVEAAECRLAHPFAVHPGVEGVLLAEPELDEALAGRGGRDDGAEGVSGIDEHAPAARREPERRLHALDPCGGEAVLRQHPQVRPGVGRGAGVVEPLEVQVREPPLRAILLEAGARTEEAAAELRRWTLEWRALRVLSLVDPPAVDDRTI